MNVLLSLLIVAVRPDAPIEAHYPAQSDVFSCDFGQGSDQNFDGWPDGWTREHGRGFPSYLSVQITGQRSPGGGRCLQMQLDGGAAAAYSPPVEVSPLYGYVLEGSVNTEGLANDRAYLSVTLLGEKRQRLETLLSEKVGDSGGWKRLRLGPLAATDDRVRYAVIGLHLEPDGQADLQGSARFADLWMGRLPRMSLVLNSMDHVYSDPKQIELHCEASGFSEEDLPVDFELADELGRTVTRVRQKLATRPTLPGGLTAMESAADTAPSRVGQSDWKPPVPGPGFYRIRVTLGEAGGLVPPRELTLAVIRPRHGSGGGEFGWTLPHGDQPLPLAVLGQLLGQVGIDWVKYPVWYGRNTGPEEIEQLVAFGERLNTRGIELVGLLARPPDEVRKHFGGGPAPQAADVFSAGTDLWYPTLEAVLARLSTRVRWWQLGDDRDASFVGYPGLAGKIGQIKAQLDQVGQDINLGMGWNWIYQLPAAPKGKAPWRFLSLAADPPLTHEALAAYLAGQGQPGVQRWVSLEPLPRGTYSVEVRATDLVRRMMAAKTHGADAIFITDPFDSDRGLMNGDGTAGELLLPWRTTALELRGASYLGTIEMPSGSHNRIFARAADAVMVVWNDKPVQEVIYLGEDVRQVDMWGRVSTPAAENHRQVIEVGPLPTFVVGVNQAVARWRMDFAFKHERIPSVFGREHANSFQVKNHFSQGVAATAELVVPEVWSADPPQTSFRLDAGETVACPFRIMLPYSADSGRQKIRVDFEVQADRMYRFSVYRHMDLGLGDVYVKIVTRLNDNRELEVQQRLVNETNGRVSFRCQLFIPNRRRLKTQVLNLGPGADVKTYRLSDGEELMGKTLWLRVVEIDGPRILNYRFVVK